ncbi:MAG: polysaccharide biosynthesis protein, partial [Alphaproteobacteria bacterium]|nr:polysaccharide biosynthesis protein [Alphaproteobacteria bacterium]
MVELSRTTKLILLLLIDASLCVVAVWTAFSLRLGVWDLWGREEAIVILLSLAAWGPIFLITGIYRSVMRFVGSRTMLGIATSCFLMAVALSVAFAIISVPEIPRTVAFLQPMVFAALLVISRLFARYILFDLLNQRGFVGTPSKVMIYGAGSAGRQLAVALMHEPGMFLNGYIDDDARLAGQHLDGVKVYHSSDLEVLVERLNIDTVLLAVPSVSHQQR